MSGVTKILFIDNDDMFFQVRQCVIRALIQLPPVEIFHASDATEALHLLDELKPDVVILDGEMEGEKELFIDSLSLNHPPVLIQTEATNVKKSLTNNPKISNITKDNSLEGIHDTLLFAASIAGSGGTEPLKDSKRLH